MKYIVAIILRYFQVLIIMQFFYVVTNVSLLQSYYEPNKLNLYGNVSIYSTFILIALLVYLLMGRNMSLFEFGIKSIGEGLEREGDITNGRVLIVRQIVSSGYLFMFFILINSFKKQFDIFHNRKYLYYSIIISIMMVCVIVGERRSSQIYIAFSCIWLLSHLYPKHSKKVMSWVGATALLVLIFMTIYKQFNAFLYDSYEEALKNSSFEEGMSVGMVDAYFNGIKTIGMNIEFAHNSNLTIFNFIYDIFRSIFGIHYFLKDGLMTSEIYNLHIYGGEQSTGYLLSSVGYGYIYFGALFAPLLTIVNVLIVCFLENKMRNTHSLEMSYIWAYVYMRFAYGCFLSTPPLINSASRFLIINGLILFISSQGMRTSIKPVRV